MPHTHIGTCGFCTRQAEFFRTFRLLEVQKTFYQPPRLKTLERWREQAPEDFEFTLKAWQPITHPGSSPTYRRSRLTEAERAECGFFRDTQTVRDAWDRTLECARALEATFVIFQCPKRFRPTGENVANMRRFFEWAERDSLGIGWEPRGKEWEAALIEELCRELDLVHVVDPFHVKRCFGTPSYFRLHGRMTGDGRFDYKYRYTEDELRQLHDMCTARPTYCLFNNDAMCDDAARFDKLLERAH